MKRTASIVVLATLLSAPWANIVSAQAPATAPAAPARGGAARGGRGPVQIGPPAPVPPEVAIQRPSADELAQINAALKKLVETDTSPAKPVLQKYQSLLVIQAPRLNTAATFTEGGPRVGRHEALVELAKKGDIELLLQGDSITDGWDSEPNKPVMDKYFGQWKTANFGVGGDTTQGVLWGTRNGEGQGFQPKAIMLMIGTNNTGSHTAPEIAEGIGAVVLEQRRNFPNAKILLLGVFPRSTPNNPVRQQIAEINKIISKLDDQKNVFYLDIGAKFLDATGAIPADIMPDGLHPNAKGYEIWGEAVKDKLAELMK